MREIISVISQKGGVGKTTTVVNLGASLALKGFRVLLIDLDPQGQVATSFNFEKYDIHAGTVEWLTNKISIKEIIHHSPINNLDFIPSNLGIENDNLYEHFDNEHFGILEQSLKKFKFVYDFIIIDCPPSLGKITKSILKLTESVIVPVQCEYYALKALGNLLKLIKSIKYTDNPNLKYRGFLITMVDLRSNLSRLVLQRLRYTLKGLVFKTIIPRNIRLAEGPLHGKPAILIDKNSRGAMGYSKLADEILNQDGTIESPLSRPPLKMVENY